VHRMPDGNIHRHKQTRAGVLSFHTPWTFRIQTDISVEVPRGPASFCLIMPSLGNTSKPMAMKSLGQTFGVNGEDATCFLSRSSSLQGTARGYGARQFMIFR
jgi:hypothetical protein